MAATLVYPVLTVGTARRPNIHKDSPAEISEVCHDSQQANLDLLAARVQSLETSNHGWKTAERRARALHRFRRFDGAKPADRLEPNVIRAGSVEAQEFILKDETGHVYAR